VEQLQQMSILSFVSKQFVDVIDWTEEGSGLLAMRFPMQDREIQNGAKLTVRETQAALFVNEGRPADLFDAGLYTLTTQTLPVLTYLQNWDKAFASPFKSDVYFFSLREQTDQKWGTPNPITIRDKEYGPLRIRAFGSYSYRVADPKTFWSKLSGTTESYRVTDIEGQLRAIIITAISTLLGAGTVAFVDMAANQQAFSATLQQGVAKSFADYGLELRTFFVQNLSLPEELQQHLDKASSMRLVGDLKSYTQFQAAESLPAAAETSGGVAGAGAGLGAGVALGQIMSDALRGSAGGGSAASTPSDPLDTIERLHELVGKGVITQEEFDAKKAELLRLVK
jgi:membrane protease subunit (stomatin/prohibitin family)